MGTYKDLHTNKNQVALPTHVPVSNGLFNFFSDMSAAAV
jgi:hypothetical protein